MACAAIRGARAIAFLRTDINDSLRFDDKDKHRSSQIEINWTHEQLREMIQSRVALADVDERKCRVVEMRYFAGASVDEAAVALGVSSDTVKRDWRIAKLWLLNFLAGRDRGA